MQSVVIAGVAEIGAPIPENLETAQSVLDLMAQAAADACADAGADADLAAAIDTIAVTRTFSDSAAQLKSPFGTVANYPRALAGRIGADPANAVYSKAGGNVPQELINEYAQKIADGDCDVVLLVGGEALANEKALKKAKLKPDWSDATGGQLDDRGSGIAAVADIEQITNELLSIPTVYALMENARRAELGLSRENYAKEVGALFAPMSEVAAAHQASMFKDVYTQAGIATPSETNPPIADPYTRAMVAKDGVNLAAAVLLMSEARADALGIAADRRIYPVSGSHTEDKKLTARSDLTGSVALSRAYQGALQAAGITTDDVKAFDLYSCFPIAVYAACDALGLAYDDPRGVTVTGGLPFFGGPGNNYSMHGVVNMVKRLRDAGQGYGVVGANGGFLSKHAVGVYAAQRPEQGWVEADNGALQHAVDTQDAPGMAQWPEGRAVVESYSVEFGRKGPRRGYIVGRLPDGRRFLGSTDRADQDTIAELLASDPLGRTVWVTSKGPGNRFTFDRAKTRALIPARPTSLEGPFQFCTVERQGNVLEVTINRPEARNSLTPEANFELEAIFDLYEADESLWVAILTGAGTDAFSSGNDLKYAATGKPMWVPETGFGGLTNRLGRKKPVIAAVNGFAMGGGFEIALACDLIVADANAVFSLPEVKVGLVAAAGGVFRLPQVLPPKIANEMILTGSKLTADKAAEYGVVNRLAEAGQALTAARELAAELCRVSPTSTSVSLELMGEGRHLSDPAEAARQPSNALVRMVTSEDMQIGMMAFMMKQPPKWKGR